ncbi:MAG TPA: ABC transporter permease [Pyrinomonadaceae bacterium]|nr:ABC transporter permease [Pyrinomonadaceae bacterium]
MPFELKLAWKYFRSRRKSLARFTSIVAVVGIAVGVASLIIAQALARGFQDEMRDKILSNTAHISIFLRDGTEIFNWQEITQDLEKFENIANVTPTTYESVIITGANAISYGVLRVQSPKTIPDSKFQIPNPEDQSIEISIGAELAEKTGLKIGDETEIISFENELAPKTTSVLVKDIFQTGLFEYDATWIYISPSEFVELSGQKNFTPTILSVSVRDIYEADKTAQNIRGNLGESFRVIDWQEANQPLFAALSLERKVSLAIISLIVFIAVLNITTTLALLVNERKFDIAILRTCGAKTKSLVSVFLIEGLFLGFLGISFGVILGLLGCFLGNYFRIINLPAEVYSLSYIPFHPTSGNVLLIILIAFVLCLAATVYPAFRASRIKPLENLRN